MEEKNESKVSLTTAILFFALIVIIIGMALVYAGLEKKHDEEKLALQEQINNLQGTLNIISTTVNNTTQNTVTETNNATNFSNDEIKNALQNYLDLVGALQGSPEALLVKLGFTNYQEGQGDANNNYYAKTNIKYSEFKTKMLNYVTEQLFEKEFIYNFKNVDGYLYFRDVGASGMEFEVKSITRQGNNSYIANVDNIHFDGSREQETMEFHIDNYNGKCVISYCD